MLLIFVVVFGTHSLFCMFSELFSEMLVNGGGCCVKIVLMSFATNYTVLPLSDRVQSNHI